MIKNLLSKAIHMLCFSGMALAMSAAMAQKNPETLQHMEMGGSGDGALTVTSSADPEGQVTTGMDPPLAANNFPELEVGSNRERPDPIEGGPQTDSDNDFAENIDRMAANADPESEVGNGTKPPGRIHVGSEIDVDHDTDTEVEITNFPEGEVTTGMDPPA